MQTSSTGQDHDARSDVYRALCHAAQHHSPRSIVDALASDARAHLLSERQALAAVLSEAPTR